ncbi:unnamed protein product [Linum tenue]|uniref:Response regulatory domain-containing protein n=1 Tax=Linum tenue TaxID=586396 RepID=A0AAV0HJ86_9ROSI|nr:unnamed protein product [Linum tenue]
MAQQGGSSSSGGGGSLNVSPMKPLASLKVLVVDDEPMMRTIHKAQLVRAGINDVEVAANGKDAVDLHVNGATFDLILMDLHMPIMDGCQATKELRAMGVKSSIVGVTSSGGAEKTAFLASGLDDCVSKPFVLQQIAHYLKVPRSPTNPPKYHNP